MYFDCFIVLQKNIIKQQRQLTNITNMSGNEVTTLIGGNNMRFGFGGNNCHVFNKETGVNLEAAM